MPEVQEPCCGAPSNAGGEVVEDYGHVGLTLRNHPITFLRADLLRRRIVTCLEAMEARDGQWLEAAGLVPSGSGPAPPKASCSSRWRTRPGLPIWWSG